MQAYDSIELKADIEVGGSDQRFNILAGRELQKKMGQKPQDIALFKLLVGTDGREKMSKSKDNYIGITEPANNIFGKIMSIPDTQILDYFELTTDATMSELNDINKRLNSSENPKHIKEELAARVVARYYDKVIGEKAQAEFDKIFAQKEKPSEVPEVVISDDHFGLIDLLCTLDKELTKSDARRLIEQGGVKINDEKQDDLSKQVDLKSGMIIQIGKRRFYKIK
jgi:tyrosyl-tRNA synthetase